MGPGSRFCLCYNSHRTGGVFAWVGKSAVLVVMFLSLIYPYFGISDRLNFQQIKNWTLDGNANLARYDPDEWAAMQWLSTVAIRGHRGSGWRQLRPAARMATQSGLPNVLGWPGHEGQWRGGGLEIGSRQGDISTLYRTRDWNEAQTILDRYQIRYIVVGNLERSIYQADEKNGLRALDEQKFTQNLRIAFQNSGVTIYEVSILGQSLVKELH